MEAKITAILTDERGWQKPFQLNEGVYWIGSADKVQIQLPVMKDISPYHLQVVNAHNSQSVRLINLSRGSIVVQKGAESTLFAPGGIMDVFGPEIFRLGPYTLHFQLQKQNESQPATAEGKQKVIGLRLVLPDVVLRPNIPLVGVLSLQNLGNQACQFRVEIDGIPEQCYEITPPPLIFAGGEENTEIRFFHKMVAPPAGQQKITLRVSAPEVYPGEVASVQQVLKVMPYYAQSLSLLKPEEKIIPAPEENSPVASPWASPVVNVAAPVEEPPEFPPDLLTEAPRVQPTSQAAPVVQPAYQAAPVVVQPVMPAVPVVQPLNQPAPVVQPAPQAATVVPPTPWAAPEIQPATIQPPVEDTVQTPAMANPPLAAGGEQAQPVDKVEEPAENAPSATTPLRKLKRPDLSSVKVIKASSGDFLEKRTDQE